MKENVFFKHLKEIVEVAYAGDGVRMYDWQKAIDVFNAEAKITAGLTEGEIAEQRSAFIQYVGKRRFDREGNEIKG